MTREEAIKILQGAIKKPNTKDGYLGQAIDMAIQALSQEPCTDAVSREAVIKLFRGNIGSESALILHMVKQLPSVNPQPCDAISREDAIQAVNNTLAEYIPYFRNDQIGIPLKCARTLNELPSVTQKSGKWITQWNAAHQKEYYYCSECREEFSYDGETGIKMNDYDFCPNCGVRMESEDKK